MLRSAYNSYYNAMQVTFQRRYRSGFSFNSNYTLAHNEWTASARHRGRKPSFPRPHFGQHHLGSGAGAGWRRPVVAVGADAIGAGPTTNPHAILAVGHSRGARRVHANVVAQYRTHYLCPFLQLFRVRSSTTNILRHTSNNRHEYLSEKRDLFLLSRHYVA
jgi:hypothetical protein